jgi:hypothetical protein
MIRAIFTLAVLLWATQQASAVSTLVIEEQAKACIHYRADDMRSAGWADLEIDMDSGGEVTAIRVLRYAPDSQEGRELAMIIAKGVQDCGLYFDPDGRPETVSIRLGPNISQPKPSPSIITMPDNADGTDNSLGDEMMRIINGK